MTQDKKNTNGFFIAYGQKVKSVTWDGETPKYIEFENGSTTEKYSFTGTLHFVTPEEFETYQKDLEIFTTLENLLLDHLRAEEFTKLIDVKEHILTALEVAYALLIQKYPYAKGADEFQTIESDLQYDNEDLMQCMEY